MINPFTQEVKGDPYKFFFTTCGLSVSCEIQGKRDVDKRLKRQSQQHGNTIKPIHRSIEFMYVTKFSKFCYIFVSVIVFLTCFSVQHFPFY